jgi:hypothetical protein
MSQERNSLREKVQRAFKVASEKREVGKVENRQICRLTNDLTCGPHAEMS